MEEQNNTRKPEQELYELAQGLCFIGEALDRIGAGGATDEPALSQAGAQGLGKLMQVLSGSVCAAASDLAKQRDNLARATA